MQSANLRAFFVQPRVELPAALLLPCFQLGSLLRPHRLAPPLRGLDRRGGVIPHRRLGDRLSRAAVHRTAVHRQLAHRTVRAAATIAVYSALILRIP